MVEEESKIGFQFEGTKWYAERLPNSLAIIKFSRTNEPRDRMAWSAPTPELNDLLWSMIHLEMDLNRQEKYTLVSVIQSFGELLYRPQKQQVALLKAMREAIELHQKQKMGDEKED